MSGEITCDEARECYYNQKGEGRESIEYAEDLLPLKTIAKAKSKPKRKPRVLIGRGRKRKSSSISAVGGKRRRKKCSPKKRIVKRKVKHSKGRKGGKVRRKK